MKNKICVVIAILIIPIMIFLADQFLFKETVHVDATFDQSEEWDYINEHQNEYPSSLLQLATRNKETIPFVAGYLKESKKTYSMNLKEDLKDGKIPLLLQWDKRWGYKSYGDDMMAVNGCGPTCLSMVASYLKQDTKLHPYYIARFAIENGYMTGSSTSWLLMSEGAERLGLNVEELSLDENQIIDHLKQGHLIICSVSKGIFTTTGHFIVLREYKDGKIYVNDPNSQEKSHTGYTFEEIQYQIKNLWVYS